MFFGKKKPKQLTLEDFHEEWEDWSLDDWINHQTPAEQARLRALPKEVAFNEWSAVSRRLVFEKGKKIEQARKQGLLPPAKEITFTTGAITNVRTTHYWNNMGEYIGSSDSYGND